MSKMTKPEWTPSDAGIEYATNVINGVSDAHDGLAEQSPRPRPLSRHKRSQLSVVDYVTGVRAGNRVILGRAISLIESNASAHIEQAQHVLKQLLPFTGHSIRVGITGVPGAGKSTFIETLGCYLCAKGHRVAVLAVDPSSSVTRGSILGDKTRMEKLAKEPNCFIRPSPSGGALGGVTRKSRETILVCEAAGFDVILIETVGVGQSEVAVRSMVDFFLLMLLSGAGDELQGVKKGVLEMADALLINKADSDNKIKAQATAQEYNRVLPFLLPATAGWITQAFTCSALTGEDIPEIWMLVEKFRRETTTSNVFDQRRQKQQLDWLHAMIEENLYRRFYEHPAIKHALPEMEKAVMTGQLPVAAAVQKLSAKFTDL